MSNRIKYRIYDNNEMFYWGIGDVVGDGSSCTFPSGHLITLSQMQYTGLKDKHGTEIYEGDIVDSVILSGTRETNTVTFEYGAFRIGLQPLHTQKDIEVVGNMYENKELLNEET